MNNFSNRGNRGMKKGKILMVVLMLLLVSAATNAGAALIDFESVAQGTYSSLVFPDVTITYTGGSGNFDVTDSGNPGSPISGNAILSWFQHHGTEPFKAVFNISVNAVSIGVGDFGADDDETYLAAYDSANNLLASDYYYNPADYYGGDYLSVSSSSSIAYVLFWEEGSYPGAVAWDNLSYSNNGPTVPEPSTFILVGAGLVGVGLLRKRFSR
jgi:hypothetical protein